MNFDDAKNFVREQFQLDLPRQWSEDLPEKLHDDLKFKAVWVLHESLTAFFTLATNGKESRWASQIRDDCLDELHKRQKLYKNLPKIISLNECPDFIYSVHAPNGTVLSIFGLKNGVRLVNEKTLAEAAGDKYHCYSDNAAFTKAIALAEACRYTLPNNGEYFLNVNDICAVLHEFAFNVTTIREHFKTANELCDWALRQDFTSPIKPADWVQQAQEATGLSKDDLFYALKVQMQKVSSAELELKLIVLQEAFK